MSIRGYYKKKRQQETNFILIILGLLLIFIIGYVFWQKSEREKKPIDSKDEQPETLEKLLMVFAGKCVLKTSKDLELQEVISRRNRYFIYTRLSLVILMIGGFLILQFLWTPKFYMQTHWFDNLRNYMTAVILGFTTIAFISKGSLKNFKESIEGMAIKWYFKNEALLSNEIQELDSEIQELSEKITQLEIEDRVKQHDKVLIDEIVTDKMDTENKKLN